MQISCITALRKIIKKCVCCDGMLDIFAIVSSVISRVAKYNLAVSSPKWF